LTIKRQIAGQITCEEGIPLNGPGGRTAIQVVEPKWYTTAQVAIMLGYSLTKTKSLILSGQIRSVKDGGNRRILPAFVDEYVARKAKEASD
jgi:excisionase family DNA binding protein